jgi:hypothetical protein
VPPARYRNLILLANVILIDAAEEIGGTCRTNGEINEFVMKPCWKIMWKRNNCGI